MTEVKFNCPWCRQHLEAPPDMVGELTPCPSCKKDIKVPVPAQPERPPTYTLPNHENKPRFPIVIQSSTRSLYAKYIWVAVGLSFLLILGFALVYSKGEEPKIFGFMVLALLVLILLPISLLRLWFSYRRIKNTKYRIFPNKIEVSSYVFRFLGVYNNVVNLTQLRQIQARSNSMLDLWFFKCGEVILTVSGDVADFEVINVYRPSSVRKQIEEIAFGKENVYQGVDLAPEVDDEN